MSFSPPLRYNSNMLSRVCNKALTAECCIVVRFAGTAPAAKPASDAAKPAAAAAKPAPPPPRPGPPKLTESPMDYALQKEWKSQVGR